MTTIDPVIDELWDRRSDLTPDDADARKLVVAAVDQLDQGRARVAQLVDGEVVVDERAKRAILLAFKVLPMVEGSNGGFYAHDRVPLKTTFDGVRVVPGAIARWARRVRRRKSFSAAPGRARRSHRCCPRPSAAP